MPLPDFVIRNQGNFWLAVLAIFLGSIVWGIFAGVLGGIAGYLWEDSFIRALSSLGGATLALLSSIGSVGAGILGGIVAYQTGKAILASLLFAALGWAINLIAIGVLFLSGSFEFLSSLPQTDDSLIGLVRMIDVYVENRDRYTLFEIVSSFYYSWGNFVGEIIELLISSVVIPVVALVAGAVIGSKVAMKRTVTTSA